MYSQGDLDTVGQQIKRMRLITVLCCLPFFIGMVVAIILQSELWSIVLGLIGAFIAVFLDGAKVGPLKVYRRFIRDMIKGLHSTVEARFVSNEGVVLYERLLMHKLTVQRDSGMWTYYFDAQKDIPAWADGDVLQLEISGDHVIAYQ
ncbi:hypothetical protein H8699_02795 [Christensenellaceae bacterium NSJ-44]|uniref:Uncharacterized protein n=1 Tax=Luoshenia tenuis TaxID=2763654 RepID=A0A926HMQ9_9FIRM|nr:hypothetical protein [Luoshenia tenuis]MBC8528366.1 hypothetical protein [Luoshenia tenuis]